MFKQIKELKELIQIAGTPGYLLIIYFVVQIVFARTRTDMAAIDSSAAIFAIYAIGCGYYSWKLLHQDSWGKLFLHNIMWKTPLCFFILYTLLCFVSSLWSPNPILSAYRAVECAGLMLLNIATIKNMFERYDEDKILKWSATYGFICVLLQFWKGARMSLDMGLYTVQFPSTIFFYLAFYFAPNRMVRVIVMLAAFLCNSVTGYIGMALGLISLLFGKRNHRMIGVLLSIGLIGAISSYGVDKVLNATVFSSKKGAMVNGRLDESKTSGRTKIWDNAQRKIEKEKREWYGTGFVVGEMQFARSLIGNQVIGMHNGFLSAYVGTGRIGFWLFTIFMISVFILPIKCNMRKDFKAALIASMCVVIIHTLGNPGLGFRVYGTWMPAMYIIILTCSFYLRNKEEFKIEEDY